MKNTRTHLVPGTLKIIVISYHIKAHHSIRIIPTAVKSSSVSMIPRTEYIIALVFRTTDTSATD